MAKGLILALAVLVAAPATAELTEPIDLKKPERPVPAAGEAMIVLRAHAPSMAGDNRILFYRIDPATGQPLRDAAKKPVGAKLTYTYSLFGGKKGEKALRVAILPAGEYVLAGRVFNGSFTDSFCFGAPRFTLAAGAVAYLGDYEMFALAKMPDRERRNAMRYRRTPPVPAPIWRWPIRTWRCGWPNGSRSTARPSLATVTNSPPTPCLPLRVHRRPASARA